MHLPVLLLKTSAKAQLPATGAAAAAAALQQNVWLWQQIQAIVTRQVNHFHVMLKVVRSAIPYMH
jgi:hypothetical protein